MLPSYGYSSAMKGADFVWDKEKLDRFIAKPDEVVPGNNMKPYGGLTSAEDRAKVIVFLESLTMRQRTRHSDIKIQIQDHLSDLSHRRGARRAPSVENRSVRCGVA